MFKKNKIILGKPVKLFTLVIIINLDVNYVSLKYIYILL